MPQSPFNEGESLQASQPSVVNLTNPSISSLLRFQPKPIDRYLRPSHFLDWGNEYSWIISSTASPKKAFRLLQSRLILREWWFWLVSLCPNFAAHRNSTLPGSLLVLMKINLSIPKKSKGAVHKMLCVTYASLLNEFMKLSNTKWSRCFWSWWSFTFILGSLPQLTQFLLWL